MLKVVYLARDASTAELVRGLLESAGVRSFVAGASLGAAVGHIPFASAYPQVCVDEADVERAERIIRESAIDPDPETCAACGYSLRGLPTPRCPECGQAFARKPARGAAWTCPACGERIEGQFTACWNCGTSNDPA